MISKSKINSLLEYKRSRDGEPLIIRAITPDGEEVKTTVDEMITKGYGFGGVESGNSLTDLDKILSMIKTGGQINE